MLVAMTIKEAGMMSHLTSIVPIMTQQQDKNAFLNRSTSLTSVQE